MSYLHDYPTPAQTSIFVGNLHVDDAYGVSFEVQNPRVPLYGYNQRYFSLVADGKILVTGNLVINYRAPGYFLYAIRRHQAQVRKRTEYIRYTESLGDAALGLAAPIPEQTQKPMDRPELRRFYSSLKATAEPGERLKIMAEAMINNTFREASLLARAAFLQAETGERDTNPAMIPARDAPFDIQLAYGALEGSVRVDTLKNCYVTGMGKVINASAHGGGGSMSGAPILETYPFIAQTVEQYIVRDPNTTDKDEDRTKAKTSTAPQQAISSVYPGIVRPFT
jgi:hypothetical protein